LGRILPRTIHFEKEHFFDVYNEHINYDHVSVLLTFLTAVLCGFKGQDSIFAAIGVGLVTNLSIIGVGMIVASLSKSVSQAFVIANFPLGLFMFQTGAVFPFPRHTLFTIAGRGFDLVDLLTPTHAVIALNKIFTMGME
jgi:ABC-2 type transport system permease protein